MVQPVALSVLLFVFAAQPLLSTSAGGDCTAEDGMCFAGEMAESRGEQLLQVGSAIQRPHKDAPDLGDDVVPKKQSGEQKSSKDGAKVPSSPKRHSKDSLPSSKKSSASDDGGNKFSKFGALAREVLHLGKASFPSSKTKKSPATSKADSKHHPAKWSHANVSKKVVWVSSSRDVKKNRASTGPMRKSYGSPLSSSKHSRAGPVSHESSGSPPKKMKPKAPSTPKTPRSAAVSAAKSKAGPGAKSIGTKAPPHAAVANGGKEKVLDERRAPKSKEKAPAASNSKLAKGAGAGIKHVARGRALASLKNQRSEPAGGGKGAGVSPAKVAAGSQTKVKSAKGTKLKSNVVVITGRKKAKGKLAAKKGKAAAAGKARELKVSVVRGKSKSKKKQASEDMEEEEEDMEEEDEVDVKRQKSRAGTLFNPVIGSVVVLMSAPAGILLLGFGIFLWAKSQEDESMGAVTS